MLHPIQGFVDPKFENVRAAFIENFSIRGEIGAAVCIYYQGKKVVDLWGGFADLQGSKLWQADDVTTLFSVTKGLVATCFLMLVDQGKINYDDHIAQYWPELCAAPKYEKYPTQRAQLTIAQLLNHRSGFLGFSKPLTLDELENDRLLVTRLEQEPLRWEPNSQQGYHGVSFGLYANTLFKKITNKSIGQFLREDIRSRFPMDLYLGLTVQEKALLSQRIRAIYPNKPRDIFLGIVPSLFKNNREGHFFRSALNKSSHTAFAFGQPSELGAKALSNFNTERVQGLELPWANALGSARGVATLYHHLLQPGHLVSSAALKFVQARQSWSEKDAVIRKPMGFSYGFVKEETKLFSPSPEAFGHPGAGGALGFADPKTGLVIAYVMNRMGYQVRSPRALSLCHAAYDCL